jgi:hypothetical protein
LSYFFALRISAMHERYALSGSRRPMRICSTSVAADGPIDDAQPTMRDGGHAPYSRWDRGRCSGTVLAEPFGPHRRAWLATRRLRGRPRRRRS